MRLLALLAGLLVLAGCSTTASDAPPAPPVAVTTSAAPVVADEPIAVPVRVDIPALGVTDEIQPVGLDANRRMEIPPVDKVGYYTPSVLPGAAGPAVLAGHRNWDGVDGSFLRIGDLKPGDQITVTGDDGHALTFAVYEVRSFPKSRFDYGFVFSDRADAEILLVTCSGDVVDRHYTDNTAVAARLVAP